MFSCMFLCNFSIKDILLWCCWFGYMLCDEVFRDEKVLFCKLCGGFLCVLFEEIFKEKEVYKCEDLFFNSFMLVSEFVLEVEVKERCFFDILKFDNELEDLEVDVVGFMLKERIIEL